MTANPSLVLNKINDITFESYDPPGITDPTDGIFEVKDWNLQSRYSLLYTWSNW